MSRRPEYCTDECMLSCSVMSNSLQPTRLLCPWDSLGKNTGVSCHFLLQRIFPTQGLNLCLLHCRCFFLLLSHRGGPITLWQAPQLLAWNLFPLVLFAALWETPAPFSPLRQAWSPAYSFPHGPNHCLGRFCLW